jgi:hypothetical protein
MKPADAKFEQPPGKRIKDTDPATLMAGEDKLAVRQTPRGAEGEASLPTQFTGFLPF